MKTSGGKKKRASKSKKKSSSSSGYSRDFIEKCEAYKRSQHLNNFAGILDPISSLDNPLINPYALTGNPILNNALFSPPQTPLIYTDKDKPYKVDNDNFKIDPNNPNRIYTVGNSLFPKSGLPKYIIADPDKMSKGTFDTEKEKEISGGNPTLTIDEIKKTVPDFASIIAPYMAKSMAGGKKKRRTTKKKGKSKTKKKTSRKKKSK